MSETRRSRGSPRVAIVGGGYGGVAATKLLDRDFEVTLVERRESFFHNIGALRGVLDEGLLRRLFMPYGNLLSRGRVVRGVVTGLVPGEVLLEDGGSIGYDYLVLATGSSYPFPAKTPFDETAPSLEAISWAGRQVREADGVLLFGGGPVGIELAGEIKSRYPEKGVALVHSHTELMGGWFKPELGKKLLDKLEEKGVEAILEEAVRPEDGTDTGTTFVTDKGTTIEANLLKPHPFSGVMAFVCFGAKPNSAYLRSGSFVTLDGDGRVKVDPYLRVEAHDDVFAVGDLTDVDEPKTAYLAQKHAEVVANNIRALHHGRKENLKTYETSASPPILVPVGPKDGVSQLPVPLSGGLVVGRRTTRRLKGRDLLVERYRKILGATP